MAGPWHLPLPGSGVYLVALAGLEPAIFRL